MFQVFGTRQRQNKLIKFQISSLNPKLFGKSELDLFPKLYFKALIAG